MRANAILLERRPAGTSLAVGLLALALTASAAGDPATEAADAVLRPGAGLKALAARDDPDPWVVADELCARGEHDAAEAFAKAAPRKDTERLPAYVASQRAKPTDRQLRAMLQKVEAAVAAKEWERALELVTGVAPEGDVTGVRIRHAQGLALQAASRWEEAATAFLGVADAAQAIGWLARQASALHEAGACEYSRGRYAEALAAWERRLRLEEARSNRRGGASTLGSIGVIHEALGDYLKALSYQERSLKLSEELGDRAGVARALGNIGVIHEALGDYPKALEHQERSVKLREELGDRAGVGTALGNIGNIHHSLGDYPKALSYQERSLKLKEELGDRAGVGTALGNIGSIYDSLGDYPKALSYQERSLKLSEELGDRAGVAFTLGNIGLIHERLGDYPKALSYQERSLKLREELGDRAGVARTLGNIGGLHHRVGDYPKALELYERSLGLMGELRDRGGVARTLGNIGAIHEHLGDYPKALEYQERSLKLSEELGDRAGVAWTFGNIGAIHGRLGDYPKALSYQERALKLMEDLGDRAGVAVALGSIGIIQSNLGDYPKALEYQERALKLLEELGGRAGVGAALGNIGGIHQSLGDYEKALSYQQRALKLKEDLGDRAGVGATLGNIGNIHHSLGDYPKALEYQEPSLKLSEELGDRAGVALTLGNIGLIHQDLGDYPKALEYQERSLRLKEELGDRRGVALSLWSLCVLHLTRGDPAEAVAAGRKAVTVMAGLVGGLADEQGATAREQWTGLFGAGVSAAAARRSPDDAAFFLESGRAGTLLETLGGRERLWATAIPEPLRMEEAKARAEEAIALKRYQKELESGGEVDPLWKEVEATRQRTLDVIARIQREAKAQAALLYPKTDSLEEIQKSLRADEALVLYAPKVALVVTPKEARIVALGDLEKTAATFQKAIVNPDERGMSAPPHEQLPFLMKKLSGMVVDALGLGDSVKRLLVCPDGVLAYIPFCALTDREVVYVPSGTVYRLLRGEESKRGSKVLALGDPKTPADPLPASGVEAKAVGDVVLLQEKATISGLRELLSTQARWHAVHFACHGLVDPERPVLSALALTPEGDEDGYLRCLDVYRMKIPADLVMLSACETAQGKVYKAEGVMGWTRAFLFAGAPRVIVSLWKVDDEATKALMTAFYENWKTMPAATALKRAQEQVASQEKWKHPYFWAAWQLWGLAE